MDGLGEMLLLLLSKEEAAGGEGGSNRLGLSRHFPSQCGSCKGEAVGRQLGQVSVSWPLCSGWSHMR